MTYSLDEYIRDPAPAPSLSASIAHILLTRSPQHAWYAHPRLNPQWRPETFEAAEIGTIAHALLLEADQSRVVAVHADDWRTKAAKEQREAIRAAGRLPVLAHKLDAIHAMVAVTRERIDASEVHEMLSSDGGTPEQTFLWQDDGVWCRTRPDWVSTDHRLLVDYKTTAASAEPTSWARGQLLSMGYDLQAALGIRAMLALSEPPRDVSFVFLVQETEHPYAVSLVGLSPTWQAFAEQRLASARRIWRTCLTTNDWPSYPGRIAWSDPPEYALYQWGERAVNQPASIEEL